MEKILLLLLLFFNIKLYSIEIIIGTETGIYKKNLIGYEKLQILENETIIDIASSDKGFYFLTENGLYYSKDLKEAILLENGIERNNYIVKINDQFTNITERKSFKKIKIDSNYKANMLLYNKNEIYLSTNYGEKWQRLNTGIKEITASEIVSDKSTKVYLAHPFYGIFEYDCSKKTKKNISFGILKFNTFFYNDISDINYINDCLYATSFFECEVYKFNKNKWEKMYNLEGEALYSFFNYNENLVFIMDDRIEKGEEILDIISNFYKKEQVIPYSILIDRYSLNSLELFFKEKLLTQNKKKARDKKGIYLYPYNITKKKPLEYFISLIEKKGLNSLVIDMKDDSGYLHFKVEDELVKKIAKYGNIIDIDKLTKIAKEKNIYLIARIVVFKDSVLYRYDDYKYAVKDIRDNSQWIGIKTNSFGEEENIKEYWVDPSNPFVWEYNIRIAKELIKKGFDEIQFDYIRFPTDGINLKYAFFPSLGKLRKEEVLFSFLRYAREQIDAPISIDIYGNNGWYRNGGATGQDVELLTPYVDVICPMFYPSHFDQNFLNYEPYDKRPYRIYYYGSLRTYHMGRKKIIVRPYVQHFKLNVSYDLEYYNEDYISNQIKGIEDSVNMGYTLWNMGGKY